VRHPRLVAAAAAAAGSLALVVGAIVLGLATCTHAAATSARDDGTGSAFTGMIVAIAIAALGPASIALVYLGTLRWARRRAIKQAQAEDFASAIVVSKAPRP
jgi:hypothetical protein